MPSWADLRKYCDKHLIYVGEGKRHIKYRNRNGDPVIISRGTGEIGKHLFAEILKNQLGITKEEFNNGR